MPAEGKGDATMKGAEEEIVGRRDYVEQETDDWKPPRPGDGTWDPILWEVETIEQDEHGDRWAYLCWNEKNVDGRSYRSKARLATVHKAAPQKIAILL